MQRAAASNSGQVKTCQFRSGVATKQVRKVKTRKIPYKVGYTWNKGGRLKELRIRQLARKYLKIWIKNTFGRILPHQARLYYNKRVLRQSFEGWRDEWWTSRREWSLTVRADCHYRYYLCNSSFLHWRNYICLLKEKKIQIQNAQLLAERRLEELVCNKWKAFIEKRRTQSRMVDSLIAQKRVSAIRSAWTLWQTRLQQEKLLKQKALNIQRKVWIFWKNKYTGACYRKKKEDEAIFRFTLNLKRRTIHQWRNFVTLRQAKKRAKAVAQHARRLCLLRKSWKTWKIALDHRQNEEAILEASNHLAVRSIQHRAMIHWKAYMNLFWEEAEKKQKATRHFHQVLMHHGLMGLSLNAKRNKAHRLNNNLAVRHHQQTIKGKYLKLWRDHLEESEDQRCHLLIQTAQTKYRTSLLEIHFYQWREKFTGLKHIQELECSADVWFVKHSLSRCFKSWMDYVLQRRGCRQRQLKADVYNRQRRYKQVFYTWQRKSKEHREATLSERIAIVHEERCRMQSTWDRWRRRTLKQIQDAEKQEASDRLYCHRLLHNTMTQWKNNSREMQNRRNRERQACSLGDLRRTRLAVDKWKEFVKGQKVIKNRLSTIQRYNDVHLLQNYFLTWKRRYTYVSLKNEHAEELYMQHTTCNLRKAFHVWREKAALMIQVQIAENHFQHFIQLKVLLAWRRVAAHAVSRRRQQKEARIRFQQSRNRAVLLRCFSQWKSRTGEVQKERMKIEKASWHHDCVLLSKALTAWGKHHQQFQRNKMMKRQAIMLLKLKMCQTYYERWKMKLQHRRREAHYTERALWHWSLTLQAKVLCGWRLWVTEQRSRREQAVRAAQVYRDQLLKDGVTSILTYAAYMNDLTRDLTEFSQEQRSLHLQRVVKRCAMRWKQKALRKPQKDQEVRAQPRKKSVTFCLPASAPRCVSDPAEQGVDVRHQSVLKPSVVEFPLKTQNQELLLPPSAFMTPNASRTTDTLGSGEPAVAATTDHFSARPDEHLNAPGIAELSDDPGSALLDELLAIQRDLKQYQQNRRQLRTWRQLREIFQNWLQTTGKDNQTERNYICEGLAELEERILTLSAELENQKPTVILYTERINHLLSVLRASGDHSL